MTEPSKAARLHDRMTSGYFECCGKSRWQQGGGA